ncbi:hypothetical protein BgAZ_300200 [Babesia gibsoni]|uniref:Ribosome recycling factor domain-containing protein n=1 Tax=Babesia gibsoni TaxID=33632 RepID=A0AAD8PDL8_BABGI|nr:hypothetical protein BgAZ_300200 [Babesia gibsoni]
MPGSTPTKVRPEEVEEEEEFFDIDDYIGKIRETEGTTLSAIEQLKPVAMTLEDLEIIQVMDKDLSDLSQIVLKSPVVVHLHVFDVKNKSKIVRELTLLRDDWNVQPDVDDLIIIRMPSPNSSQVMKAVAGKAAKIQEKHHQQVQQIVAKANAMIKQVNIGNNWHRKQYDLLNNATKSANERIKAAIKRLTSV